MICGIDDKIMELTDRYLDLTVHNMGVRLGGEYVQICDVIYGNK